MSEAIYYVLATIGAFVALCAVADLVVLPIWLAASYARAVRKALQDEGCTTWLVWWPIVRSAARLAWFFSHGEGRYVRGGSVGGHKWGW